MDDLKTFVMFLTYHGGSIVSSNSCTPEQVADARKFERLFVMDDGIGFVYIPPVSATEDFATR